MTCHVWHLRTLQPSDKQLCVFSHTEGKAGCQAGTTLASYSLTHAKLPKPPLPALPVLTMSLCKSTTIQAHLGCSSPQTRKCGLIKACFRPHSAYLLPSTNVSLFMHCLLT